MPLLFLSPSVQEYNLFVNGGSEEYYMNLVADAMVPYLYASGISYSRNNRDEPLRAAIDASNAGNYKLHLALHSNAAPEALSGMLQGADVYYYPGSAQSYYAAEIIARNYRAIYPDPSKVKLEPGGNLAELRRTKAPAVLLETAYHDNETDAQWIKDNIDAIARNLVFSLTQYFGLPFIEPTEPHRAIVSTYSTALNIRESPSVMAPLVGQVPRGAEVIVYGQWEDWAVIGYQDLLGYSQHRYLTIL